MEYYNNIIRIRIKIILTFNRPTENRTIMVVIFFSDEGDFISLDVLIVLWSGYRHTVDRLRIENVIKYVKKR